MGPAFGDMAVIRWLHLKDHGDQGKYSSDDRLEVKRRFRWSRYEFSNAD